MTMYKRFRDENKNWYSPSFYTHEGGYKMCIRVRPHGQDEGEGQCVSLYVHLMKGEYDEVLPWPFQGAVKIQLLNQEANHHHYTRIFTFNKEITDSNATKKVLSGTPIQSGIASDVGHGSSRFIHHKDLKYNNVDDTEYLKDDTILIRVSEVAIYFSSIITKTPEWYSQQKDEPVATLKLSEFSKHRKVEDEWHSKSFYSHEKGYTFMLIVYANGKEDKEGKSVSVYVHLKQGEHDDKLIFPFRGEVCVQLLNQLDDTSHVQKIIPFSKETDEDGTTGGRVVGTKCYSEDGLGFRNFIPHEYLAYNKNRNTQYLDEDGDTLLFQIPWIKVNSM